MHTHADEKAVWFRAIGIQRSVWLMLDLKERVLQHQHHTHMCKCAQFNFCGLLLPELPRTVMKIRAPAWWSYQASESRRLTEPHTLHPQDRGHLLFRNFKMTPECITMCAIKKHTYTASLHMHKCTSMYINNLHLLH